MNRKQNNCPRGHRPAMARYTYNPTPIPCSRTLPPAVAKRAGVPANRRSFQSRCCHSATHPNANRPYLKPNVTNLPITLIKTHTRNEKRGPIPHSPDRPLVLRRLSVKLRRILSPQADSSNTSNAFCRSTAELPARLLPSRLPLSSGLIEPSWPHLSPPASENDGR